MGKKEEEEKEAEDTPPVRRLVRIIDRDRVPCSAYIFIWISVGSVIAHGDSILARPRLLPVSVRIPAPHLEWALGRWRRGSQRIRSASASHEIGIDTRYHKDDKYNNNESSKKSFDSPPSFSSFSSSSSSSSSSSASSSCVSPSSLSLLEVVEDLLSRHFAPLLRLTLAAQSRIRGAIRNGSDEMTVKTKNKKNKKVNKREKQRSKNQLLEDSWAHLRTAPSPLSLLGSKRKRQDIESRKRGEARLAASSSRLRYAFVHETVQGEEEEEEEEIYKDEDQDRDHHPPDWGEGGHHEEKTPRTKWKKKKKKKKKKGEINTRKRATLVTKTHISALRVYGHGMKLLLRVGKRDGRSESHVLTMNASSPPPLLSSSTTSSGTLLVTKTVGLLPPSDDDNSSRRSTNEEEEGEEKGRKGKGKGKGKGKRKGEGKGKENNTPNEEEEDRTQLLERVGLLGDGELLLHLTILPHRRR